MIEEQNLNATETKVSNEAPTPLFWGRKRIVVDPNKVIKTKPIYIKEPWCNLFG